VRQLVQLDKVFGFEDRKRSTVKKRKQLFDERTGEHVLILEYRVVKEEHSDPKYGRRRALNGERTSTRSGSYSRTSMPSPRWLVSPGSGHRMGISLITILLTEIQRGNDPGRHLVKTFFCWKIVDGMHYSQLIAFVACIRHRVLASGPRFVVAQIR
jgi:hypothetical protein